jgi:hypothetical protein
MGFLQRCRARIACAAALLLGAGTPLAEQNLLDAVTGGAFDAFLRYRFEYANDGQPGLKQAYASTLRSALGYRTGDFHDFSVYVQLEDVRVLGGELFNDGGSNGETDRAVVLDPPGFKVHQAYLRYAGLPRTVFTAGRQEITHRQAPFHRFIGNQLWRQNFQSFDGIRLVSLFLPKTILDYSYVFNVNRVLGEDSRLPDGSDYPMNSHFFNVQFSGFTAAKLEAYAYLLDFTSRASAGLGSATVGLRVQESRIVLPKTKLSYAAEYAFQTDYGHNSHTLDVSYALAELGLGYAFGGLVESGTLRAGFEMLGGRGAGRSFQTPLATLHVYQGFADRFLSTPGDGVLDYRIGLDLKVFGGQFGAVYHLFGSDRGDYAYGDEWDLIYELPLTDRFLLGIKYAQYRADQNPDNLARNRAAGQAFDLDRFWSYLQFAY